jgi:hypothetical protein
LLGRCRSKSCTGTTGYHSVSQQNSSFSSLLVDDDEDDDDDTTSSTLMLMLSSSGGELFCKDDDIRLPLKQRNWEALLGA